MNDISQETKVQLALGLVGQVTQMVEVAYVAHEESVNKESRC